VRKASEFLRLWARENSAVLGGLERDRSVISFFEVHKKKKRRCGGRGGSDRIVALPGNMFVSQRGMIVIFPPCSGGFKFFFMGRGTQFVTEQHAAFPPFIEGTWHRPQIGGDRHLFVVKNRFGGGGCNNTRTVA